MIEPARRHLADRLRQAVAWARRTIAAMHADGVDLRDGQALNLWHLITVAEEAAEHVAPGAVPPPCLWSVEPPAPGYLVPGKVTLLIGGTLVRYSVDHAIGGAGEDGTAKLHRVRARPG